jgi:hypothetical protein
MPEGEIISSGPEASLGGPDPSGSPPPSVSPDPDPFGGYGGTYVPPDPGAPTNRTPPNQPPIPPTVPEFGFPGGGSFEGTFNPVDSPMATATGQARSGDVAINLSIGQDQAQTALQSLASGTLPLLILAGVALAALLVRR